MKITNNSLLFKAIVFLIFATLHTASYSQGNKKISISGSIIDSTSKQAVEFASVAVYKQADNSLVTGIVTNEKGSFSMELMPGEYLLKASFVGYKTTSKPLKVTPSSPTKLGNITLVTSSKSIDEVQVTGNRAEKQVSIEKTKVDVSQNMSAVSGNVTDVLKSQSAVSIDAENNVYLRGNSNILILLDGRPTTVTSLGSIPSSNIDNIEIITNPDAKYDAEGTGGIINIVTKKQSISGLNGTVNLNVGIKNRINGGIGLNYTKSIWSVGFNYNGRDEKTITESQLTRELYTRNTVIDQDIHSVYINPTHTMGLTVSAKPNNKNIISLTVKSMLFDNSLTQTINGTQSSANVPDTLFNRTNKVSHSRRNIDGAFSYKRIFEKNTNELSFDAMYSTNKGSRTGDYLIEDVYLQKSDAGGTPTNITVQLDYFKQIFKSGRVETGVKTFSRWNTFSSHFYDKDTTSGQWMLNPKYSNDLDYKEYIHSGYLMYSDSLLKKVFYKIGGRVEYNTSDLVQKTTNETVSAQYLFPFPFLLAKYQITKSQNVAVSLTRRVTRPIYSQLNPYIVMIDQMTYETGNQKLKPEITDKLECNHSLSKDKFQLRTNVFYGITNDFITQVSLLSSNNLIVTYVNGSKKTKTGFDVDGTYKLNKKFSINPGFSVFYSESNGTYNEIDLHTSGIAWTGNLKFTIKPEAKTDIQLLLNYNSPIELPQFKLNEMYYSDFAVKRTFLKDKMALSFSVTDVFNTRQWIINSDNSVYRLYNTSKSDTRVFWVGISYNFNSYKSTNGQKNENSEGDGGVIKLGQ